MIANRLRSCRRQARAMRASAQAGFALIEVMVSVLLFVIGVLGLVGLQATMTQAQSASKMRTDAAYLASELLGRMWTDMGNRSQYTTANCGAHPACKDWFDKVARDLPSGTSALDFDVASGDIEIVIGWSVPDGGTHRYSARGSVLPSE